MSQTVAEPRGARDPSGDFESKGDWPLPTQWRLKCADEVRRFIRMLRRTSQRTTVAVIADGMGPGRKIQEGDLGGNHERESPNHGKMTGLGATTAPLHAALAPNTACA